MPPMVVYQSCIGWLTHCHRGQAPSHIWASVGFRFVCGIGQQEAWKAPWHPAWRVQNCWRGLSWLQVCMRAWPARGMESILAPSLARTKLWGLAPDGGVSVMYRLADTLPSGASPLPHLVLSWLQVCMRAWPARGMESTLAPSLARTKLWEGACPPDSGASVMYRLADTLPSGAGPLPYLGLSWLQVCMRDWPARGMESTLAPSLARTKLLEGACPRWWCISHV
ncbi:hypothetical protein E5845_20045 [Pseudomonas fluorescens]|nr:hypothetical protein E5845_20045 [Pseudomonas fluorescens]